MLLKNKINEPILLSNSYLIQVLYERKRHIDDINEETLDTIQG